MIQSRQNEQVKTWAALRTTKGRTQAQAFLVEGEHSVVVAWRAHAPVQRVLYVPGGAGEQCAMRLQHGERPCDPAMFLAVSASVMDKITDATTPQPIAAIVSMPPPLSLPRGSHTSCIVAMDAVQDPGNVGTIVRAADSFGATAVLLGTGCADVYHPKTVRATMGSLFHVPLWTGTLTEALVQLRQWGVRVVATSPHAPQTCASLDVTQPTCFVVGNEGTGICADVLACCDTAVHIPMQGRAESLNVAMATTVLLYETMRKRQGE